MRRKGKRRFLHLPWVAWLAIAIAAACAGLLRLANHFSEATVPDSGELKAAIVDQLYTLEPNQDFIQQTKQKLESHGFHVDVYQGDEVTVGLYKRLPLGNYQIIILRTHSGILSSTIMGDVVTTAHTYLFTDELYDKTHYAREQLLDEVLRANISEDYHDVFAVGAKFVAGSMQGRFPRTIIVAMGCTTTYSTDLAKALTDRGASVFLGWDGPIRLDYVDQATPVLLDSLFSNVSIEEAMAETIKVAGPPPDYVAHLKLYPSGVADKTIQELMSTS